MNTELLGRFFPWQRLSVETQISLLSQTRGHSRQLRLLSASVVRVAVKPRIALPLPSHPSETQCCHLLRRPSRAFRAPRLWWQRAFRGPHWHLQFGLPQFHVLPVAGFQCGEWLHHTATPPPPVFHHGFHSLMTLISFSPSKDDTSWDLSRSNWSLYDSPEADIFLPFLCQAMDSYVPWVLVKGSSGVFPQSSPDLQRINWYTCACVVLFIFMFF